MEEIKLLLKELQKITRYFSSFEKVDLKKNEGIVEFEKRVRDLPTEEIIGKFLDEWKVQAITAIERVKTARKAEFSRHVTEFIRGQRDAHVSVREFHSAWRVGPFELRLRPEQACALYAYNNEVLVKWFPVVSGDHLVKKYSDVKKQLEDMDIPTERLVAVFWESYEYLKWKRTQRNEPNASIIPVQEFYREVVVQLLRKAYEMKQPAKELPLWAFLYNLDRYCAASTQIPQNKRIGLQSGSQHEVSSKKGVIVNGLDAYQDYKTICFIIV
jgi:hypothetical protein